MRSGRRPSAPRSDDIHDAAAVDSAAQPEVTTPTVGMTDDEVEAGHFDYSIRHPKDWLISGPLPQGGGPGRRFPNWAAAEKWAREKYGARLLRRVKEAATNDRDRWCFVIRGER